MKHVKVSELDSKVLPKHERVYASEIWGTESGARNCVVMYNEMEGDGGAQMHTHPESEHIFYVLMGEMSVTDGNERWIVKKGESLIVPPGEPHEARATGDECHYLLVTSPPAIYKED